MPWSSALGGAGDLEKAELPGLTPEEEGRIRERVFPQAAQVRRLRW